MLNTSIEFQSLASAGARPLIKAKLFLANGGSVDLTGDDFMEGTPSFTRATSSSGSFDIGAAIVGSFSCTLNNFDGRFEEFDFKDSRIVAQVGFELSDGSIEWLRMGTYWTDQPASYGEVIALSCEDSMVKFDVPYDGVATRYPATAATVVSDICERAGVPLLTQLFSNSTVVFQTRPKDGCSCRDVLSWAAQATGNFARITNDDRLMIGWYDPSVFDAEDWVDGGEFDGGTPSYESGDDVDGGNFTDYSSGDDVDGGTFTFGDVVSISAYTSISVYTDDVAITGIRVTASDEVMSDGSRGRDGETSMVGSDEYVIDISGNPLIGYGQAAETARRIGARCVGLVFRPFDATCHGTPVAEPGDCAVITDRKDNAHRSFITSATYKVGGSASYSCSAEPPLRNASYSQGALTKAVLGMDGKIEQERTAREAALQRLNDDLESASGMYSDTVTEGGASTWYIHDKREPDGQKPGTFSASKFVWKINAAGFGMSVNGGKSYQFGLDKWGSAILNTIYAIGLDASYINTGALRVRSGSKTIFCADVKAGQFWWDATYSKLTNTGALTVTSGRIGGFTISAAAIANGMMTLDSSGLKLGSLMTLNSTGIHLRSSKGPIGHIETNGFYGKPAWNGILFNLSYDDGWYIAWACQRTRGARPEVVMLYSNVSDSFYTKDQVHLSCDFNMHWNKVRDTTIENSYISSNTWFVGGVNGTTHFTYANGYVPGTTNLSLVTCYLTFSHGFVTGIEFR